MVANRYRLLAVGLLLATGACQSARYGTSEAPVTATATPQSVSRQHDSASPAQKAAAMLSVSAPRWQIGDRWRYNDGYGLQVEDAGGGVTLLRRLDDPTQWISRRGFLREAAQSATAYREIVYRSIPADAGMSLSANEPLVFTREYTANNVTRVHVTSWMLEGQERISVPAGAFDTYIVVMRTRNAVTGWTGFERWWYAPAARNYVRMEYRYGDQGLGSRVLIDFQPAGTQVSELDPDTATGDAAAADQ
ncbi:hypothetical protein [Minwuia sp.]|uniref:hypothetical protein n=1 Tax=Minwuia sp. TaxID=2493630 RepID=UPI003A90C69D